MEDKTQSQKNVEKTNVAKTATPVTKKLVTSSVVQRNVGQQTKNARPTGNNQDRRGNNNNNKDGKRGRRPRRQMRNKSGFEEVVVDIARVTKVVKGGRRFSFSTVVVVGDKKGKVGIGHGKANEVPDSIKKAIKNAIRNAITVPIHNGHTIPYESENKFLSSKVVLKPAQKGRGLIASSSVRMVVELAGYKDIYSKTFGSRNKQNVVKSTIQLLANMRRPEDIARGRGKTIQQILKGDE